MTREGIIGHDIALAIRFYANGEPFDPYSVGNVEIYTAATGGSLVETLSPVREDTGFYTATWSIPSSLVPATLFDEWIWVADEGMVSKTQRYTFSIVPISVSVEVPSIVRAEVGCRSRPYWESYIGVRLVQDIGNGMGLNLSWGKAIPADQDNLVHYNIYYADTRFGVFSGWPEAITTEQYAIINVDPGKLYYFAVRATEFDPAEFDLTQLTQIGTDVYQYPDDVILLNDIDAYGNELGVDSTVGFPDAGFLLIDEEVMQYSSRTNTEFIVEEIQRGAIVTYIDTHSAGAEVKLWRGVEDQNTVIFQETAAWHRDHGTPRNVDEVGEYNVASDGYKESKTDILTTDLSASDAATADFPSYDFSSYHRPSLEATFSGDCVNSYVGGEFNGGRGLFLQDRNIARLNTMLSITGEPIILLRRKWTGRRCRCQGLRREHPRTRCQYCFSVGFDEGYTRYVNPRPVSESSANTQGFIMARIGPYTDDLELDPSQSLRQTVELDAWTINIPNLKDRDFVIRYNEDGTEEFRYEVLDVNRNKLFFGQTGKQGFRVKRHDKTDIIYSYLIEEL